MATFDFDKQAYILADGEVNFTIPASSTSTRPNAGIYDNALANILTGDSTNNRFHSRAGADILIGGLGNDSYLIDDARATVQEKAGEGDDIVIAKVSYTIPDHVETLRLFSLSGIGLKATGNQVANKLIGDGGGDTLDGGLGADTLDGYLGNDTYIVDQADDVIVEEAGHGLDTVLASCSYTLAAGVYIDDLILTGTANLNGTGNELANTITGNAGANFLSGGEGNDTLDGGKGVDHLEGGAGNDTYIVNDGSDLIADASGYDKVLASVSHKLVEGVEELTATGAASLLLVGNTAGNIITGNSASCILQGKEGHDVITGSVSDDEIYGGTGNDYLKGGAGRDIFVFDTKLGTAKTDRKVNYDSIDDFNVKLDRIYLDNAIFKKLGKGSENKPAKLKKEYLKIGSKAQDANDYLVYNKKTGVLSYDPDGSGAMKAIEVAQLGWKLGISYQNFFVI